MTKTLQTPRLTLVQTPLRVLKRRLEQESFTDVLSIEGESVQVTFPSEWPGDAFVLFPRTVAALEANPETDDWSVMVLERATGVAVGQMGFKGPPDEKGRVEIGYGVNASYEGRGYATEGVKALILWASKQPRVEHVVAECLIILGPCGCSRKPDSSAPGRVRTKKAYSFSGSIQNSFRNTALNMES